jgi:hypothetical protein
LPGVAGVALVAFVDEFDIDSGTWLAPKKGFISMMWILEIKTNEVSGNSVSARSYAVG